MRHYYFTRSGRLSRQDNTLCFEPAAETAEEAALPPVDAEGAAETLGLDLGPDALGDLALTPAAPPAPSVESDSATVAPPVRVRTRKVIPVNDVDSIWVFRELDLNARVLVFLSQHQIPIHFFNYYGYYAGSYYPREYLNAGFVLVKQVEHYGHKRRRTELARELVSAALHNLTRNLRYYGTRGADVDAQTAAVKQAAERLPEARDVAEVMACEGRARAAYYQAWPQMLRSGVEFTKRVRRPPDNMVNALMSFANGLVYSATLTQIYRTQLNPTISFLHEPGFRRYSLALDLAEIFKPLLADRLLFKLINQRQLDERHFAQDLNCCYLKPAGREVVLREWDKRLQTTIEHRRLKRKVSYERLIRLECYKLVRHLTGDETYQGFRAWW